MVVARVGEFRFEVLAGAMVPAAALLAITISRFGIEQGFAATLLFVLSLLVHEAGHVLTALLTGTRLTAVGFCLWGAYTRREPAPGVAEILIAAAGPAMNLLLVAVLWDADGLLGWLGQMNAVLAVINLVPIRGSDGRRILSTIQEIRSSSVPVPFHPNRNDTGKAA